MTHLDKIFRKTDNTVTKEVGDECIIVPMADNVADMESVFTLNDTGAFFLGAYRRGENGEPNC